MKKFFTVLLALLCLIINAAFVPAASRPGKEKVYASEIFIPIGKSGAKISLLELSTINRAELEKITGNKMNGMEKKAFRGAQKKLQKGINGEGVITNKKLNKYFAIDGDTGFHLGGFALGLFAGLIGVLIAYLINDDKKSNRTKWAWIGLGVGVLLTVVLVFTILKNYDVTP